MDPFAFDAVTTASACGGFSIALDDNGPRLSFLHGVRKLTPALLRAVWAGVCEAPQYIAQAIGLLLPRVPYRQIELLLIEGDLVHGEAVSLGEGRIRLWAGESSLPQTVRDLARHEALHLLLASHLGAGERWNDPELAFADWIVRGIEAQKEPGLPRLLAPLPRIFDPLPVSREEVHRLCGLVSTAPAEAARIFGPDLFAALQRLEADKLSPAAMAQSALRLVESSLGMHYLEEAARLGSAERLRAVLLDDWLLDYQEYARAFGNAPSGAGSFWRLSQAGWSSEALVRLAAAAQALQIYDAAFFTQGRFLAEHEPIVWKNRGRVRLPLIGAPRAETFRNRSVPLLGMRAALRETDDADASRALEEAAQGAERFEAAALWPRILARLLAAQVAAPRTGPAAIAKIQVLAGRNAEAAHGVWSEVRNALAALAPEMAAWIPQVSRPQALEALEALADGARRGEATLVLVHGDAAGRAQLASARRLAALRPVRGAIFMGMGPAGDGDATKGIGDLARLLADLPDFPAPLDPRYREGFWSESKKPEKLAQLPGLVDLGTASGRVLTPLCHLLSAMAPGVEECLYQSA